MESSNWSNSRVDILGRNPSNESALPTREYYGQLRTKVQDHRLWNIAFHDWFNRQEQDRKHANTCQAQQTQSLLPTELVYMNFPSSGLGERRSNSVGQDKKPRRTANLSLQCHVQQRIAAVMHLHPEGCLLPRHIPEAQSAPIPPKDYLQGDAAESVGNHRSLCVRAECSAGLGTARVHEGKERFKLGAKDCAIGRIMSYDFRRAMGIWFPVAGIPTKKSTSDLPVQIEMFG
ncbi:hypothetical protein V8F33_000778 [Rhypophila sp. PSN 637]